MRPARLPRALSLRTLAVLAVALWAAGARDARADLAEAKKQLLAAQKDPDWKARRSAYMALVDYDGAEAVEAMLAGMPLEAEPAVLAGALDTLNRFRTPGAKKAALDVLKKGKPAERLYAVLALSPHKGADVDAALAEVAAGPSAQAAAQAALILAQPGRVGAVPALMPLLAHKEWQVRAAAARGLGLLVEKTALKPLAAQLAIDAGTARAEIVKALQAITKEKWGDAPLKWKAVAEGADAAAVKEEVALPPTAFGIPIAGQRVVFVLDRSLETDKEHPFDRKRLEALCSPPDGAKIPWFRLKTKLQFACAHLKHAIDGLPASSKFGVVDFCKEVGGLFERKLVPANAANRKLLGPALDALKADDGIDLYDALNAALDIAGADEAKAWKAGPDEILLVTCNGPNAGPIKGADADAVATAIGLKARLRMVPVHVVGIGNHPFTIAESLAARTGGTYLSLVQ